MLSQLYIKDIKDILSGPILTTSTTYTNPYHVSKPSPVVGFHDIPQINMQDELTGYVMVPNKGGDVPDDAVILNTIPTDCSDPTHVSKPAPVPNATTKLIPVYNHCPTPQLIGYIGQVVKNSASTTDVAPTGTVAPVGPVAPSGPVATGSTVGATVGPIATPMLVQLYGRHHHARHAYLI